MVQIVQDVTTLGTSVSSAEIEDDSIVNADVNSAAAIVQSKLVNAVDADIDSHTSTKIVGLPDQTSDIVRAGGLELGQLKKFFEHFFSGDSIDAIWTTNDVVGTNTFAMTDGIDNGLQITTGANTNDRGSIDFNDIRHFDPVLSTMWALIQVDDAANMRGMVCITSLSDFPTAGSNGRGYEVGIGSTQSNIYLGTSSGASSTTTTSGVARSNSVVAVKVISDGTSTRLYLLVSGAWNLEATITTTRTTDACQPSFFVITANAAAEVGRILYMKVQND